MPLGPSTLEPWYEEVCEHVPDALSVALRILKTGTGIQISSPELNP